MENDATEEHHNATHLQSINRVSDYQDESYHPIAASEGDHVREHNDLDTAIEHALSVGDVEIRYHGE
jgi:hypothetical protein